MFHPSQSSSVRVCARPAIFFEAKVCVLAAEKIIIMKRNIESLSRSLGCIVMFACASLAYCVPLPFAPSVPAMVDIPAGSFVMGFSHTPLPPSLGSAAAFFPNGDADEQPAHTVSISAFRIAATETTNAQYELFDPSHKLLRGKYFFSHDDDDAVRHAGVGGGGVPHSSLTLALRRCCGCPTTRRRSTAAGSRPDWPTAGRALSPPSRHALCVA